MICHYEMLCLLLILSKHHDHVNAVEGTRKGQVRRELYECKGHGYGIPNVLKQPALIIEVKVAYTLQNDCYRYSKSHPTSNELERLY